MKKIADQYAAIAGCGSYLPPRVVSNHALAATLAARNIETSHDWILSRTGIMQRHFVEPGVTTSDLAVKAAAKAIDDAGLQCEDIDLTIVATSTPDYVFPSTACLVQNKLGMTAGTAFDVQAVCSGFVYALTIADNFIRVGRASNVLVIGADVFSRILDWDDQWPGLTRPP